MDFTSIIGISFGLGCILLAQALEGGNLQSLLQLTAFMIVAGGTIGAVVSSFPANVLLNAMKEVKTVFVNTNIDFKTVIDEMLGYAVKARKEGVIILKKKLKKQVIPL